MLYYVTQRREKGQVTNWRGLERISDEVPDRHFPKIPRVVSVSSHKHPYPHSSPTQIREYLHVLPNLTFVLPLYFALIILNEKPEVPE